MSASLPDSVFVTSFRVLEFVIAKELTSSKLEKDFRLFLRGVDVIGCDVHDKLASVTSIEFNDVMHVDLGYLLTGMLSKVFNSQTVKSRDDDQNFYPPINIETVALNFSYQFYVNKIIH